MNEVVIAMTESDAHVVANKLLEIYLTEQGYNVVNLGACAPLDEVIESAAETQPVSIILGSQNGHALEDISELNMLKKKHGVYCPVVMGGNLSVGAKKSDDLHSNLRKLGVDYVCNSFEELPDMLVGFESEAEVAYA